MIIFIVITAAIIVLLALFFTIPAGLIALALYIPLAIIMIEFLVLMADVMMMSGMKSMPKTPSCFASGTKIKTKKGKVNVEDLTIGTVLHDGSVVTSTMKLSSHNQIMYNLHDVIVSDTHKVLFDDAFVSIDTLCKGVTRLLPLHSKYCLIEAQLMQEVLQIQLI